MQWPVIVSRGLHGIGATLLGIRKLADNDPANSVRVSRATLFYIMSA